MVTTRGVRSGRGRPLVVRAAALAGYAEVAHTFGLDPALLARQAGVQLRTLVSPDSRVPARRAIRLLELSAAACGIETFGLAMSRPTGLSHLGVLGLLARDEADVRSVLLRIIGSFELHSTCLVLQLEEAGDQAVLSVTLLPDGERAFRQSVELAVAQLFRSLQRVTDGSWRPIEVRFIHRIGASDRPHRALFGCPVRFSAERNALVLRRGDLDRAVPGADAGFRSLAGRLQAVPIGQRATATQVRSALLTLLPAGHATSRAVAASMGMDRRTLHRHLVVEQQDFSRVLSDLRSELAVQYLQQQGRPCAQVAQLLGFNLPSSFTRWFTRRFGCSPSAWMPTTGPGSAASKAL